MANFQTHLYGGVLVSGGAVLALQGTGWVGEGDTPMLFGLGVVGSLLPDIDADTSAPVRAFFGVLGAVLAFAWTLPLVGRYGPGYLVLLWVALFLAVRVLLCEVFARLTVHRGIWHSLLAAVFAALATVNLIHGVLDQPPRTAWAAGVMVGVGYLTHLVLDEAYSVDLLGVRTKRSFGTALKPWSLRDPVASLAMATATAVLLWLAPEGGWDPRPSMDLDQLAHWLIRAATAATRGAERFWSMLDPT